MKKVVNIKAPMIEDAKKLAQAASKVECNIDIAKGSYVIDAKSIMGIFSLDMSVPVELSIHDDSAAGVDEFLKAIQTMIV